MTTSELLQRPVRPAPRAKTIEPPPPDTGPPAPDERRGDPEWARPALFVLLAVTAAAYLWDLSASGYANSFYAAAVQAGTKSWKAFFFGSIDAGELHHRRQAAGVAVGDGALRADLRLLSWSMLVPQALEGVAAVGLLYATIKRWFGAGAGLIAGALFAVDAGRGADVPLQQPRRAARAAAGRQRLLPDACARACGDCAGCSPPGALVGAAFLAKMMQAFLVLPAFALVYLDRRADDVSPAPAAAARAAAPRSCVTAVGGCSLVALWPVGSRPMIDGSPDNSILNLISGYNGLGRIFGSGGGPAAVEVAGRRELQRRRPARCDCSTT